MSAVGDVIGDVFGGITGAKQQGESMERAAQIQADAAREGIKSQDAQFAKLVELMSPYVTAGNKGLSGQSDIAGLNGFDAQQAAVGNIERSPLFAALTGQGEDSILQNASATGGLRGGNTQAALAQFRPQLLNSLIEQTYARYGGISQLGQAAAAGQAAAGQNLANATSDLLGQAGAAQAGGVIGRGSVVRNTFGDLMGIAGGVIGAKKAGLF